MTRTLSPEAQRRHDQANRDQVLTMALGILESPDSTDDERELAREAIERANEMIRCRICGCSETEPCEGGCAWMPDAGNICSVCAVTAAIIAEATLEWLQRARDVRPSALVREVRTIIGELPAEIDRLQKTPLLYGPDGGEL